jgi:hypothetical protein
MSQALILAHFSSWMAKNYRATMKTRYCGHLYSSLLRKWTWWGHRDQVSYYMEGGLKGTEGSPPREGWGPCRSPSKHFTLVGLPCGFALMGLVATELMASRLALLRCAFGG